MPLDTSIVTLQDIKSSSRTTLGHISPQLRTGYNHLNEYKYKLNHWIVLNVNVGILKLCSIFC